jgi:hypothetical protein
MRALATALGLLALAGCAALRPTALDVAPGQHAVLGRVDISRLAVSSVIVDIIREDGSFDYELPIGPGAGDFAIALPPGRYWIARVRLVLDRQVAPDVPMRGLRVSFDVEREEPAVYIGTLRLSGRLADRIQAEVVDEYARTLPVLRGWYSDLPATVGRSLMKVTG